MRGSTVSAYTVCIYDVYFSLGCTGVSSMVLTVIGCSFKMHVHNKDPVDSKFVATNIYTGEYPMIFIIEPKVKSKYILSHGTLTI